ncbi:MAG: sigma-70 family RNA polymerase sigma factor [Proteobacteria bacterium]|nr:sigma-70 family RNA polymerase sigma factor [Pseudomonadota bacterium]
MSRFQTTRWSLIAQASIDATPVARAALEQLCRIYRPPVLAYVRRAWHPAHDAEDMAQAFFLRFIERGWYADADPGRGRFRHLLLAALRHFLADQSARAGAVKRGLGNTDAVIDPTLLADAAPTPEQAFHAAWIATVLTRALTHLQREWRAAGRQDRFDRLGPLLVEGCEGDELRRLAAELGMRSNTLAVQIHRLRSRLRQLVRMELLQTVDSREALDLELADLREALGAAP